MAFVGFASILVSYGEVCKDISFSIAIGFDKSSLIFGQLVSYFLPVLATSVTRPRKEEFYRFLLEKYKFLQEK